jgi:hypothetical protein
MAATDKYKFVDKAIEINIDGHDGIRTDWNARNIKVCSEQLYIMIELI